MEGLAIVVVNYGTAHLLEQNLVQVGRSLPGVEIVVVDNTGTPTQRREVEKLAGAWGWQAIFPPENLGFGGGMNVGVAHALDRGATELLLLNPDATLPATAVRALRAHVTGDPMTLVAPRIERPDGSLWFAGVDLLLDTGQMSAARHRGRDRTQRRGPWLTGACLMMTRELWSAVGGFDEDYFLYWEDVDLSMKVLRAGGRLLVADDAIAVHEEGGSHATGDSQTAKSEVYYYYNIRNRLLYAAKHLPDEDVRRWIRASAPAAYEVLRRGGGRRQLLRSPRPVLAALRGTRDGLRLVRALRGLPVRRDSRAAEAAGRGH